MTFGTLAFRSAFRNPLRTVLTSFGVAIAVVAFLFLRTIISSFTMGVDSAAQDRLITRSKISITFDLPLAYATKIRGVPGVEEVSWSSWFGGTYKDPRNFFPRFAVDVESYLRLYPEYLLTPAEKQAFLEDKAGCVVGENLATKYGFKVGDKIPLIGDIYPGDWSFTVRGIYRGRDRATDRDSMFFHWKYLDEQLPERRRNSVGIYAFKVRDAKRSGEVAQAIDALFANSLAETRTESEKAFQLSFLSMSSAIVAAINWVAVVMLLILALILGNTMAMSTRERTNEYAVMRAVGFAPSHVVGLVLAEAAVVAALGYGIGVVLAGPLIQGFLRWGQTAGFGSFLAGADLSPGAVVLAGVAAVVGGVLATGLPAWQASRLKIVEALRQVD